MEIKLDNVSKKLDSRNVLNGLSFTIPDRQCTGIVGPNGAGKTTLIRILLGLYEYEGKISFDNAERDKVNIIDQGVMFILDSSNLFYKLSVMENIEFYVRVYNPDFSVKEIQEKAEHILDAIQLREYKDDAIGKLSRGMRQRLCIGRTMAKVPGLLILDEPYLGLDVENQFFLTEYLVELKKKGTTILISAHDLTHMEKMCDKVAFIKQGKIIKQCSMNENTESLEELYKRIIIGENK